MRLCDRACRQTYLSNGKPGLGDRTEEQVSCMRMVHGLWFSRARVACDITNKRRFMGQSVQVQMENNALCLSYMFELQTFTGSPLVTVPVSFTSEPRPNHSRWRSLPGQ